MVDVAAVEADCRGMFSTNLMCGESVFLAVARGLDREADAPVRLATGFCAGMGRSRGTCGALSGGILALNLFFGRDKPGEPYDKNFAKVAALVRDFETRFKAVSCPDLTGCDLGTDQGRETFGRDKIKEKICLDLAGFCAARAAQLIASDT